MIIILLLVGCSIGLVMGYGLQYGEWKYEERKLRKKLVVYKTELDLKNYHTQDNVSNAKNKSHQNTCLHPEHAIKIRVVEAYVTCETVEHYCSECGKVICSITDCL